MLRVVLRKSTQTSGAADPRAPELGWETIDVIELPQLDEQEDAENLHRREITALERDELLAEWVRLCAERKATATEEVAQLGPLKELGKGRGSKGGVRQIARDLGTTRQNVERALKVGNLSPEAKEAARKHGLADNRDALLAAAKAKTPEAQVEAIERRFVPRLEESKFTIFDPDRAKRARRRWPA